MTDVTPTDAVEMLRPVNGLYTGTLTYLDYSSEEVVALQTVSNCYFEGDNLHIRHMINEWGNAFDQHYVYAFKDDGVRMDGKWDITTSTADSAANFVLVLESEGKDGNQKRPCTFRTTLKGNNKAFTITKEVRFDDEAEFFIRNQYKMERIGEKGEAGFIK